MVVAETGQDTPFLIPILTISSLGAFLLDLEREKSLKTAGHCLKTLNSGMLLRIFVSLTIPCFQETPSGVYSIVYENPHPFPKITTINSLSF